MSAVTRAAIDLIIAGTRPEVYDPPRTPPFTAEQAKAMGMSYPQLVQAIVDEAFREEAG